MLFLASWGVGFSKRPGALSCGCPKRNGPAGRLPREPADQSSEGGGARRSLLAAQTSGLTLVGPLAGLLLLQRLLLGSLSRPSLKLAKPDPLFEDLSRLIAVLWLFNHHAHLRNTPRANSSYQTPVPGRGPRAGHDSAAEGFRCARVLRANRFEHIFETYLGVILFATNDGGQRNLWPDLRLD
jgi:hypothetical protein